MIAGAVNGGSALVVQPDPALSKPADFSGKRIATPQFGNTQDVAARAWLVAGGLAHHADGRRCAGRADRNPDQLSLFQSKQLDAVWTVEPWVSRLESEAGGKILVEEKDAITTILVSSAGFLAKNRDLAKRFVAAHRELTEWIRKNPEEAQRLARDELQATFRARHVAGAGRAGLEPHGHHVGYDAGGLSILRDQRAAGRLFARYARSVPPDRGALMDAARPDFVADVSAKLLVDGVSKWFTPSRTHGARARQCLACQSAKANSSAWSARAAAASPPCSTSSRDSTMPDAGRVVGRRQARAKGPGGTGWSCSRNPRSFRGSTSSATSCSG